MLRRVLIWLLILCGIGVAIAVGYTVMIMAAFGAFDKDYSVSDLKESFKKKETEIYELKRYFNEIAPSNRFIEIEFENDNILGRFGITALDSSAGNPHGPGFLEWDLKVHTERMDSIIRPLGWTRETLETLKAKLDEAHCIGIESGEPAKIGFQRSGMGMYFFNVYDQPIPDGMRAAYNDSCTYILASDRLVLEYGGGAVGSQCFYNRK